MEILQASGQMLIKSIKTEKVIEQAKDVEEVQDIITSYPE